MPRRNFGASRGAEALASAARPTRGSPVPAAVIAAAVRPTDWRKVRREVLGMCDFLRRDGSAPGGTGILSCLLFMRIPGFPRWHGLSPLPVLQAREGGPGATHIRLPCSLRRFYLT